MPGDYQYGSGPYVDGQPDRPERHHQKVLNESWPKTKDGVGSAVGRELEDKPYNRQVQVRVRAVFEHDGETWLNGRAIRWNRSHVCVYASDPRLVTPFLWVLARDVQRR